MMTTAALVQALVATVARVWQAHSAAAAALEILL